MSVDMRAQVWGIMSRRQDLWKKVVIQPLPPTHRYQKFFVLTRPGGSSYRPLLNPEDEALLPLLASFQRLSVYKRVAIPEDRALPEEQLVAYYDGLIEKYIGRKLLW
jgi:hypothetical protein